MQAFEVLGDPVRRRVLELIADGEVTSGGVCAVIRAEFGISQPAVVAAPQGAARQRLRHGTGPRAPAGCTR